MYRLNEESADKTAVVTTGITLTTPTDSSFDTESSEMPVRDLQKLTIEGLDMPHPNNDGAVTLKDRSAKLDRSLITTQKDTFSTLPI